MGEKGEFQSGVRAPLWSKHPLHSPTTINCLLIYLHLNSSDIYWTPSMRYDQRCPVENTCNFKLSASQVKSVVFVFF